MYRTVLETSKIRLNEKRKNRRKKKRKRLAHEKFITLKHKKR